MSLYTNAYFIKFKKDSIRFVSKNLLSSLMTEQLRKTNENLFLTKKINSAYTLSFFYLNVTKTDSHNTFLIFDTNKV